MNGRVDGCSGAKGVFSALSAVGHWVKKGSCRTLWVVPPLSSCLCSHSYGQGAAVGPQTGGLSHRTPFWTLEGRRTPDEATLCEVLPAPFAEVGYDVLDEAVSIFLLVRQQLQRINLISAKD